ncbi:MAG: Crp/Fnr family transcriptional regulator [Vitreimonas sp.]
MRVQSVTPRKTIVVADERSATCCLIVEGFFSGHKGVGEGALQITSFHLPGDIPDLQTILFKRADFSVSALTPGVVALIPHIAFHEALAAAPALGHSLWRLSLGATLIGREWLCSVGRRTAYQRMAHLFCELYVRMRALGLAQDSSIQLPLTQAELADALGLSAVHVNRTLQQLRRDGVIECRRNWLVIIDWPRLRDAADFDAGYLTRAAEQNTAAETSGGRCE